MLKIVPAWFCSCGWGLSIFFSFCFHPFEREIKGNTCSFISAFTETDERMAYGSSLGLKHNGRGKKKIIISPYRLIASLIDMVPYRFSPFSKKKKKRKRKTMQEKISEIVGFKEELLFLDCFNKKNNENKTCMSVELTRRNYEYFIYFIANKVCVVMLL